VPLLRLPQPYDFELSTRRFRAWGPDRANWWSDDALYRVVAGREVRIAAADGGVEVEPLNAEIEREVRWLLGEPFDLGAFYRWAESCVDQHNGSVLELVHRFRGLRPVLSPNAWEALVTSITAQQVSLHAAFAIRNRLVEAYGEAHEHAYAFPPPETVASVEPEELLALGFSRRKAEYVVGLARAMPDAAELAALPDDEVKARLTALRGLGEWTADWFLARHLARPRAWPAGDLAVRKAVSGFYGGSSDGRVLTTEEVREIGARFDPFQNLTCHYLLAGLVAS
jgi:DNA-3-methyladenine glycosylase II